MTQAQGPAELATECVPHETVDDEVGRRVEDHHGVGDVGQDLTPELREPERLALDDFLHVAELVHIHDNPCGVAQEEYQHNAEEDQAKVDLLPLSPGRAKPLDLGGAEVKDNASVQVEQQDHGDHRSGEEAGPHYIGSNVCFVLPQVGRAVRGAAVLVTPVQPDLHELGDVDGKRDEPHRHDVEPRLTGMRRQHGMAQAQVALNGDGHRHEDGSR